MTGRAVLGNNRKASLAGGPSANQEDDVQYQGPSIVREGSPLTLHCRLPLHRFASWRRGGPGSTPIVPDPWNRYRLNQGPREPDRTSSTLTVLEAQLNHSGDYFCSSFSPIFHSVTVLPRGTCSAPQRMRGIYTSGRRRERHEARLVVSNTL
ncbi:hypothetical protein HPB47_019951 [Ixodes persulcatus]|uniref:Uncharacterized protein n=1 Tax=Ixodes persulcatus TaxID=34615 RepID=A0AC60QHQ8_IXOPE|nr:hypothetical protein HPB47_019951 [Ixodes persulcatus]